MGLKLGDLDQYFDPGLTLPVLGREYVVPLPSAELGLWCRRMAVATGELSQASTDEEIQAAIERVNAVPELPGDLSLAERVLGSAWTEMVEAGVPDPFIQFCGMAAYIWIIADEETVKRFWESGGRPEAQGPGNRAQRRAAAKRTGGSRTGEASGTPSPASTSGTTSRTRSGRGTRGRRTGR